MPSHNYDLIRKAILEKKVVIATYNGYRREMCPHVIGFGPTGREQALFYQFGGQSSTGIETDGSSQNWRCIPLTGLRNVEIEEGGCHTAPNHSRPQTCVSNIDVEVDY